MDFQLILYIIIVIVWLILDNYRRIKKKQEQADKKYTSVSPKHEAGKPYTTLEDILSEFGMEEAEVVVEHKPKPEKKTERQIPAFETYENYESSINKDYKFSSQTFNRDYKPSVIGASDIKKSEITEITGYEGKSAKIDFDLRKAVIWSELLKRPYA